MPTPGSIVRCRERDWVLLPSTDDDRLLLRPLTGRSDEVVAISRQLSEVLRYDLPTEAVSDAHFPLPTLDDIQDAQATMLLWQAARMALRDGATPLRSPGRISIRPRLYQFVPLLMALRLQPVRLLIADDVGVGKTIEALLIARELWDRGEIRRLAVLCPPYLCEQWQHELQQKFQLDAVVLRPGTITQLERQTPRGRDIYQHFPVQVISIDWLKLDRNRYRFLQFCPDLVIVDEAHSAVPAAETGRQLRYELVREIAAERNRHLILLTATPHSGAPATFRSLIGLLDPEFADWDVSNLNEKQRLRLARHFVQRTRADIEHGWADGLPCFPQRVLRDESYLLTPTYHEFFNDVYNFCTELVSSGSSLREPQRRVRYWAALSLLRCVMSSPAAAVAALRNRSIRLNDDDDAAVDDTFWQGLVFEADETETDDEPPAAVIEQAETHFAEPEQRRLRRFAARAEQIAREGQDAKLTGVIALTRRLLTDGYAPIIWCRYVATAEYVAQALRTQLPAVHTTLVTGRMGEEERRRVIADVPNDQKRVLVATDCISEGINLHERYNAAIHYDLPWNPNRLEQREGRIDRYGQIAPKVVTIRYYGLNNEVDGVVIDVLLRKAREIRRALGTHVPVPSESVVEALTQALFLRPGNHAQQLTLELEAPATQELHRRWEEAVARERITRTRFAQHALKLADVQPILETTGRVLGDPAEVCSFVLTAAKRLGIAIRQHPRQADVLLVEAASTTPDVIRSVIADRPQPWPISFVSPTPAGAEYVGRNHRLVSTLSSYLFEVALVRTGRISSAPAPVARLGVIRTNTVARLTVLILLRARYLVNLPARQHPLLAEEALISGFVFEAGNERRWLTEAEARHLLTTAQPDANLSADEKRELAEMVLAEFGEAHQDHPLWAALHHQTRQWADDLRRSYRDLRQAIQEYVQGLQVTPIFPPDLLGILILQPMPRRPG